MAMNWASGKPLVKISAFCFVVSIHFASMPLSLPMWDRKKWYLRDKYLFREDIFGVLTMDRQP